MGVAALHLGSCAQSSNERGGGAWPNLNLASLRGAGRRPLAQRRHHAAGATSASPEARERGRKRCSAWRLAPAAADGSWGGRGSLLTR
jgi:hypothetical protein